MVKKLNVHYRLMEIYSRYPRKMGKTRGFKTALSQCKKNEDFNRLEMAVTNYVSYIIKEKVDKPYILYFSTFMNQWEDWLDPDVGSAIQEQIDLSGIGFDQ